MGLGHGGTELEKEYGLHVEVRRPHTPKGGVHRGPGSAQ